MTPKRDETRLDTFSYDLLANDLASVLVAFSNISPPIIWPKVRVTYTHEIGQHNIMYAWQRHRRKVLVG